MKNNNRFVIALLISLLASLMLVSVALAHNSGHIILPDGQCLNAGSLEERRS